VSVPCRRLRASDATPEYRTPRALHLRETVGTAAAAVEILSLLPPLGLTVTGRRVGAWGQASVRTSAASPRVAVPVGGWRHHRPGPGRLPSPCIICLPGAQHVTHKPLVVGDIAAEDISSVGFIVGLAHNTFNKSINSMIRNTMWCMICTVREFD
jgi:hypothetical protein